VINKAKLILIAAIAASSFALPAVGLAQSAYTTGAATSRATAGYPSLYGFGSGLYAHAPGQGYGHAPHGRNSKLIVHLNGITRLQLAYGGHNFDRTTDPFNSPDDDPPLDCGRGRVRDPQSNQCRGPADISTDTSSARFVAMTSLLPS
jgi:hypothetical protein